MTREVCGICWCPYDEKGGCGCQTLDAAMRQPRAMAQAYENGYKAGAAAERERIIKFLQEMQRQVGDAHNHYGVAAVRIKEGV